MARALSAPPNLPSLVKTTFAKALSGGDLHYFPTKVAVLPVNSVPFQLRFSPALANKPKPPQDASSPKQPSDPFANPPAALYIADVGPSHYLVLNKFAIVPEHFILATKAFKQQTDVLEEADLDATLACIEAFEADGQDGQGLFAFFNSGEHSGASQPHRHIQLLPIARMRDGLVSEDEHEHAPWDVLADGVRLEHAPFVVFSEPISPGMSGAEVHAAYVRLHGQARRAVDERAGPRAPTAGGTMSYNLAVTRNRLVLCPRLAEGAAVRGRGGHDVGRLALNGTVLAGTALVKNEAEWDALRADPACLADVLGKIGLPRCLGGGG